MSQKKSSNNRRKPQASKAGTSNKTPLHAVKASPPKDNPTFIDPNNPARTSSSIRSTLSFGMGNITQRLEFSNVMAVSNAVILFFLTVITIVKLGAPY